MEVLPAERVLELAHAISRVKPTRGVLVAGFVNAALRLVLSAEDAGIPLGDVAFWISGEPLTPLKRRQIEERGFKTFLGFGTAEMGSAAWACPAPQEPDDLHLFTHKVAVRQYPRVVGQGGEPIPAFLFTTLQPHARYVMVNAESGDYGGLEERRCGCFLDRAGLHLHMHTIRSFEKLNAEGMTFVGPALIHLVGAVLPRAFGGDSRDYQFVEAEDKQGFTKIYVLASPRLGDIDEEALRRAVLREIGEHRVFSRTSGSMIRNVWAGADAIRVLRRDPLATPAGKVLHLHRVGADALHRSDPG